MQPVEAMTRLIALADGMTAPPGSPAREAQFAEHDQEQNELAISVIQAMLNTALPVARFRCFVRIESGPEDGCEFTVCATKIQEVVAALMPMTRRPTKVYVSLWEQRATGADMLAGYQGVTRPVGGGLRKTNTLAHYLNGLLRNYGSAS